MTDEQMIEYAREILDGKRTVKKAEMNAFLRALVEGAPPAPPAVDHPPLGFEVQRTGSGVHLPREVNRAYTHAEARALVAAIEAALR